MIKLFAIEAGYSKADGGACFGVVPRKIWGDLYPADENNLITLSQRCLLVEEPGRITLIDTGMGNKQSEKFYSYQHRHGDYSLLKSLDKAGYAPEQITDVIFTHLHFDHCGGALTRENEVYIPVFPNAIHFCSLQQWEWANNPNPREAASYFPENYVPLYEAGKLKFIEKDGVFSEHIALRIFNGHTEGQIVPLIKHNNCTIVYTADFIPSVAHIPIPYIPSYDTRPLLSMQEKEAFLTESLEKEYILFFEHDYMHECCTLKMTDKGIRADKVMMVEEALKHRY